MTEIVVSILALVLAFSALAFLMVLLFGHAVANKDFIDSLDEHDRALIARYNSVTWRFKKHESEPKE